MAYTFFDYDVWQPEVYANAPETNTQWALEGAGVPKVVGSPFITADNPRSPQPIGSPFIVGGND